MSGEGPNNVEVHKYLPYLVYQDRYQRHRVTSSSKTHAGIHRYIKKEMEFLDISSLGASYQYVVKIEHKFICIRISGSLGLQIRNNITMVKETLNHITTNPKTTSPSHKKRKVMGI
jgi:hypothetical protein